MKRQPTTSHAANRPRTGHFLLGLDESARVCLARAGGLHAGASGGLFLRLSGLSPSSFQQLEPRRLPRRFRRGRRGRVEFGRRAPLSRAFPPARRCLAHGRSCAVLSVWRQTDGRWFVCFRGHEKLDRKSGGGGREEWTGYRQQSAYPSCVYLYPPVALLLSSY